MSQVEINNFLAQLDGYIHQSAKYASNYYISNGFSFTIFEGIETPMTEEFVVRLYRELITDLIRTKRSYGYSLGVNALIMSKQDDEEGISINILLGISFPDSPPNKKKRSK